MDLHTGKREACIRDSSTRHFKHFLLRWGGLLLTSPLGTAFSLKMLCEGNCRLFLGNRLIILFDLVSFLFVSSVIDSGEVIYCLNNYPCVFLITK